MLLRNNMVPIRNLVNRYYRRSRLPIIPYPLMKTALDSLPEALSTEPNGPDIASVQNLFLKIFENSSQPIVVHQSLTAKEYYLSITGPNMRREVIGNILTLAAVSFIDIPNSSRLLSDRDHDQSRTSLLGEILSAADCYQKFCNQIDENELVVSFHHNYSMLATFRHGYSGRNLRGKHLLGRANQA